MNILQKLLLTFAVATLLSGNTVLAQTRGIQQDPKEETLEAVIVRVVKEKEIVVMDKQQLYQKLELKVTKGSLKGEKIIIENGKLPIANLLQFKEGDKVLVNASRNEKGKKYFYITDYIRREALFVLFILFAVLAGFIAKWKGITSLIGMAISFWVLFSIILPRIASGSNPVLVVLSGSLIIIPVTFYLSHGINRKTSVAIAGTLIALIITGFLAISFVQMAHLTGFSSEEAGFLQVVKEGSINMKGLLLAGIIIGVLGVLDDITVSQSAIVFQLKEANPKLNTEELYKRSMNIGSDHIASMVNTLILVYTGASLPLLLLFIDNPHPFMEVINYEIIADEIVRTLVGSIGLVLAVPMTTIIASYVASSKSTLF